MFDSKTTDKQRRETLPFRVSSILPRLFPAPRLLYLTLALGLTNAVGCNRDNREVSLPSDPAFTAPAPAAGPELKPRGTTPDARIALQRMVAAYKALDSLQVKSIAEITFDINGPMHQQQTTVLKYKRNPARVAMIIKDPGMGTQKYFADGTTVVQYLGVTNQFVRRTVKPDLGSIVTRIDKDSPQVMSPLIFILSDVVPLGIESARIEGHETLDGRNAIIIKGAYSEAYMRQFGEHLFDTPIPPTGGDFTLWLEEGSNLLLKSEVHIGWKGYARPKGPGDNSPILNPKADIVERATEIVQNPTFALEEFRFIQPKGVKEIFVEGRKQMN